MYQPKIVEFSLLNRPQPLRVPQIPFVIERKLFSKNECDAIRSYRDDPEVWKPFTNRPQTACKYPREWEYLRTDVLGKIDTKTAELNAAHWKIDIVDQYMFPRLLEYTRGHSMGHHVDYQPHCGEFDKLCSILMLSGASEYAGGELHMGNYVGKPLRLGKGDVVFFPTFQPHWVARVSSGRRLTMTFWTWGPAFR